MADEIKFLKMSGAGNDFVVIDNREKIVPEDKNAFAAKVCDRRWSVGADGLLLVEQAEKHGFTMRYFNADGSEADMCGNGARCIARFANIVGAVDREMTFKNLAGEFGAVVFEDGSVRVDMTDPHSLELNKPLKIQGQDLAVHSVNTGVPHAVMEVGDIDRAPVVELGREIRNGEEFRPDGTNANFVQVTGPDSVAMRTYERGVEDETLACGTGAVACAVLMARLGRVSAPVKVTTRGGPVLEIDFKIDGDTVTDVQMKGEAKVTFEGTLRLPDLGY